MDSAMPRTVNAQSGQKGNSVRTTISLSADALEKLDWLADLQGISRNEAIRRAIATEAYIREELSNASKILVRKEDKSMHELVFVR